jgi:hypothetical protein
MGVTPRYQRGMAAIALVVVLASVASLARVERSN